eukprot:865940-Prorocentrum_minimum.AAC.1
MPPPLPRDPKPRSTNNVDRDSTVRGTNDDATVSKLYASKLMNLCLLHILSLVSASRGYFSRVAAMRTFLDAFLAAESEKPKQVVSLGCGFDTTFFQLKAAGQCPARYIEVDYQQARAQ